MSKNAADCLMNLLTIVGKPAKVPTGSRRGGAVENEGSLVGSWGGWPSVTAVVVVIKREHNGNSDPDSPARDIYHTLNLWVACCTGTATMTIAQVSLSINHTIAGKFIPHHHVEPGAAGVVTLYVFIPLSWG